MNRQQVSELISKAEVEPSDVVGSERRAHLNAALLDHLASEFSGDLASIVRTFSEGGHLLFNGVRYDTAEELTAFHRDFGWDGRGLLSDIGGEVVRLLYTHDSVVVEYVLRAKLDASLEGAPEGRTVEAPMCVIYRFDGAGKLESERAYVDTAAFQPEPIPPL